ncbi:MAG: DsbA family oxidoreductase [Thermodesulfobacteriota bacterium]
MQHTIEIVSDVVCPWCYVGKRRLEKALRSVELPFRALIVWRPFQLHPDLPREGMDRRAQRAAKFGSWGAARERDAILVRAGAEEGIGFAFEKILRTPNTFTAHRLIWLSQREGVQDEVAEALFAGYFVDGLDIGRSEVLVSIAESVGLNGEKVTNFLAGNEGVIEVQQEEAEFRLKGVSAVPLFLFNGRCALGGAQPPGRMTQAIERAFRDHD